MVAYRNWKTLPPVTLTAAAQKLTSNPVICQEFTIQGLSTNSGDFFLGNKDILTTTGVPRAKSTPHNFYPVDIDGEPKGWDLSQVYVVGTAGDVVRIQYVSWEDVNG